MLDKAGLVVAFDDHIRFRQSSFYVATNYAASDQHIAFAAGVHAWSIRGERGRNRGQRGQFFPGNRKLCQVQRFDGVGLSNHGGYGLTSESGFGFGKYRLVREWRNHAVAVLAGDVFRGENPVNPRMGSDEGVEIAKTESCAMVRAANRPDDQRSGRTFVGAENLRAIDFTLAVETDKPRTHGATSQGRLLRAFAGASVQHGGNNFAVTGTAAEHAADGIHNVAFAGRGIALEQRGGRHQHSRSACAALRSPVTQKRLLQLVANRRASGEAFDRSNCASFHLPGCDQAGAVPPAKLR